MATRKIVCSLGEDLKWYIKVGDEDLQELDHHLAYLWIYKGMELWQAYQDGSIDVTISRIKTVIKADDFNEIPAYLIARMENYELVNVKLCSDGVYVPLINNLTKFSFEAYYDPCSDSTTTIPATV